MILAMPRPRYHSDSIREMADLPSLFAALLPWLWLYSSPPPPQVRNRPGKLPSSRTVSARGRITWLGKAREHSGDWKTAYADYSDAVCV